MDTILVVEDYDDSRTALLRLLAMEGYRAFGSGGAREALQWMESRVPALILLDFRMPEMDGLELFDRVRADPRLARVPVIMFSAENAELRDRALARGITDFVTKGSLDWAELRKKIIALIGPGTAVGREAPRPARQEKRSG